MGAAAAGCSERGNDFPTTWTLGVCVCVCVSGVGNKITCGRLDALTGSLGGGQVLAHCFLVLLGPPSISVASLLGEEEPGKLILAEVLERRGLGGSAGVDAADVSCLPAPPPP